MNQLKSAKSAYLQQHKDNPVEWMEWSEAAFARAKAEDKPILLSGGYSACHWCHVMAHESFEDPETAAVMNRHFVNVKLDREEHPDIDHLYQQALSMMGEPGGWPLTMFLTAEGAPFFGGTYFPPQPKFGRPSFKQILEGIANSWQTEQDTIHYNVEALMGALKQESTALKGDLPTDTFINRMAERLISGFDPKSGGFGSAPKFPQVPLMLFLADYCLISNDDIYRKALLITLDNICQGGIYDHLGGGFFRYSTDQYWLVPHFEKMLYDNALMIRLLTRAYKITPNRLYKDRIYETIAWLMRDMSLENSPFFAAALDADTDAGEGVYYLWQEQEIDEILGIDAPDFKAVYDVRTSGNWEGKNILNRLKQQALFNPKKEEQLKLAREKLQTVRVSRTAPARDDKCLADWNAMTAVALLEAGLLFNESAWLQKAEDIYNALSSTPELFHCRIGDTVTAAGLLDDYAWLLLLSLKIGQSRNQENVFDRAKALYMIINDRFKDPEDGGYFMRARDEAAPLHVKSANDTATPAGNAVMAEALADMALLFEDIPAYQSDFETLIRTFSGEFNNAPYAMGGMLKGCLHYLHPLKVTINSDHAFKNILHQTPLIHTVTLHENDHNNTKNHVVICYRQSCQPPLTDTEAFKNSLEGLYS